MSLMISTLKIRIYFYRIIILALVIIGIFYAGSYYSTKNRAPDLARLYMQSGEVTNQPPVVFVHGVMGSKLRKKSTGEELWTGSIVRVLTSDYSELALDINADTLEPQPSELEAFEVCDTAIGKDFYGKIINTLHDYGEYKLTNLGDRIDRNKKHYYIFYYDWRQDNVITAGMLADFIEQVRKDYKDPELKVDIVAHSMGGLITRYYIRYGRVDVLGNNDFSVNMYGGDRIRRTILLGTPNLGSIKMMNYFINGIKIGLTDKIHTETLATMPSLLQLFPHPLNNWLVTIEGKPLELDLFDINIWRNFQWSIFDPVARDRIRSKYSTVKEAELYLSTMESYFEKQLERARRFIWSLSVPLPDTHPKIIVFGGGCELTPARIVVEKVMGESLIRMYPDEIASPIEGVNYNAMLLEPGDGSVTKSSLLATDLLDPTTGKKISNFLPMHHSFVLCEKHNSLTANINFQDNLLHELLSND